MIWNVSSIGESCNIFIPETGEIIATGLKKEIAFSIVQDHNRHLICEGESKLHAIQVLSAFHKAFSDLRDQFIAFTLGLSKSLKEKKFNKPELVDIGYLSREIEILLDDLRKDAKARKEFAGAILAESVIQEALSSGGETTVHGTMAYASCDCELIPGLPKRDSDDYFDLCRHFGVPEEVIKSKVLKIDFEEITKKVQDAAGGLCKKIPGINKTWPKYSSTFTKKRN